MIPGMDLVLASAINTIKAAVAPANGDPETIVTDEVDENGIRTFTLVVKGVARPAPPEAEKPVKAAKTTKKTAKK